MIIIDKTSTAVTVIVTVSDTDRDPNPDGNYVLSLRSRFDNHDYAFPMGPDTSAHPERFNRFELPAGQFSTLREGDYSYAIMGGPSLTDVLEVGLAKLVDGEPEGFISIGTDEDDDDYITL